MWTRDPQSPKSTDALRPVEKLVLPDGFRSVRVLVDRPGTTVVLAEHRGERAVVRIEDARASAEQRAELAVLAAVEHRGLSRLIDFGALRDGRTFVARSWIEGRDLAIWSKTASPEAIGGVIARLAPALEHLHQRGFVHADLKASNVIVTSSGDPVITDFGLSRASGEVESLVSGSWFSIAPETLLGAPLDFRADLFALGAMLTTLLVAPRVSPREFYGAFPARDFFEASGIDPSALPSWARTLAARLVSRDPSARPSSALAAGRALAARLSIELGAVGVADAPRWNARKLRDGLVDAVIAASDHVWLRAPLGEDPTPFATELALALALAGVPVRRLDLAKSLADVHDTSELDRWSSDLARRSRDERWVAALSGDSSWPMRALESSARALAQVDSKSRIVAVAAAERGAPADDVRGLRLELAPLDAASIREGLAADFPRENAERLDAFARLLERESGGSATALDRLLGSAARAGFVLVAEDGWRLRPGALPNTLEPDAQRVAPPNGADARLALAALLVCDGRAPSSEIAATLDWSDERAAIAIAELLGEARVRRVDGVVELVAASRVERSGSIDEAKWKRLHARRAELVRVAARPRREWIAHSVIAGLAPESEAIEEARALRERGLNELALELCERIDRWSGSEPRRELAAERAAAWSGLGEFDRALEIALELDRSGRASERSLAARVRAQVAVLRHDFKAALAAARLASELDPKQSDEASAIEARALYESRRDREVCELAERVRRLDVNAVGERARNTILELEALALSRLGENERARALLESYSNDARKRGHAQRVAALCIDLAGIERRIGDRDSATRRYEEALASYEGSGFLPGATQARALLGSLLRENGELASAEELLGAARESRERLGDRSGALTVRGMLALVYADRGRIRSAIEELEQAAKELSAAGKSVEAALLSSRAQEMAARIGVRARENERRTAAVELAEGDPRILLSIGRAQWMRGELEAAAQSFRRSRTLASSLGSKPVAAEGELLLALLERREPSQASISELGRLAREDRELLGRLSKPNLESDESIASAEELARRGRDDRAARLYFALAARTADPKRRARFRTRADELFSRCAAGLSAEESAVLEDHLCAVPDPFPEDFRAEHRRAASEEEFEMEVVSLLEINRQLLEQEELKRLLGTIVEKALEVSGAQRGFLILEENGELSFDTARDSRRGDVRDPDLEVSRSVLAEALERMQPLRVSNAAEEPEFAARPSVIALDLRSILCVPFRIDKNLRGVIYVDHRLVEGAFTPRAERLLSLLADQAGLAILQMRRMDEIRRLNRELRGQVVHKESELKSARRVLADASVSSPSAGLIGSSSVMREVFHLIERAAPARLPVLITGESGTGKELAARALHSLSTRNSGPFVSESCAALPATLIESELFGTRRGAFTGADRDREGLIERAHGGTLFLDEIGELPIELQATLLRVLETSEVRRLGETASRKVDFRLLAATNRDLEAEVRAGRFRADLYYRLDGLRVRMPSLRERASDIPELVDHFLRLDAAERGVAKQIAPAVLARLARRAWPGNVRELFNEIARLAVMSEGDIVDPELVRDPSMTREGPKQSAGSVKSLAELEKEAIYHALEVAGGDKRKAAQMLGISRAKIYQRLKDWGDTSAEPDAASGDAE